MTTNAELTSALVSACYVLEHQVNSKTGRACWYRHSEDSVAAHRADGNYIGGLLREFGLPSVSCMVEPDAVQGIVVGGLKQLQASLIQVKHPAHNGALRWLVAYGIGLEGLTTMVALEPGDSELLPDELWPNVTGEVVTVMEPSPNAIIVELVGLSRDLDEEES